MCVYMLIYLVYRSGDLNLDQVTLTYELDPDILKVYLHAANEVSR